MAFRSKGIPPRISKHLYLEKLPSFQVFFCAECGGVAVTVPLGSETTLAPRLGVQRTRSPVREHLASVSRASGGDFLLAMLNSRTPSPIASLNFDTSMAAPCSFSSTLNPKP